jgi:hypothetical protein
LRGRSGCSRHLPHRKLLWFAWDGVAEVKWFPSLNAEKRGENYVKMMVDVSGSVIRVSKI